MGAGADGSGVKGLRIAEASPHLQSKSTPLEPGGLVPVCREQDIVLEDDDSGSEAEFDPSKIPEPDWLPSYLIRAKHLDLAMEGVMLEPLQPGVPRPRSRISAGWCSTESERQRRQPVDDAAACTPTSPKSPAGGLFSFGQSLSGSLATGEPTTGRKQPDV